MTKSVAPSRRKPLGPTGKPEPGKFNDVVAHARIQSIRLVSTKFEVKPDALTTPRSSWRFEIADRLDEWHCDNEGRTLRGEYIYTAICRRGRSRLIGVEARYVATFALSGTCDRDASHHFLDRVGRFSCYPYFRAAFATLTEQSGLGLPPLPIIQEQPRLVKPAD